MDHCSLEDLDTNVSMVLASMTSWGRSFQSLMVLGRNEYTTSTGFCSSSSFSKFVKGKQPTVIDVRMVAGKEKKKKKRRKEKKKKRGWGVGWGGEADNWFSSPHF